MDGQKLAYGLGDRNGGRTLTKWSVLPDFEFSKALLQLADRCLNESVNEGTEHGLINSLLYHLCWTRFYMTITGQAAEASDRLDLSDMFRGDARNGLASTICEVLNRSEVMVPENVSLAANLIVDAFLPWPSYTRQAKKIRELEMTNPSNPGFATWTSSTSTSRRA